MALCGICIVVLLIVQKRSCVSVSIEVLKSQHKYVIGRGGSGVNEILATTGVSVEVPPLESSSETITLRGEADKLGIALTSVYAKASDWNSHQSNDDSYENF